MTADEPPRRYAVVLRITATGPTAPHAAAGVLGLLRAAEYPRPWTAAEAAPSGDGRAVQLRLVTAARQEVEAARLVVDALRGLLGLDATFTSWVIDGRHVEVRELDR